MNKLDDAIGQVLSAEDRELLARHAEPGYLRQAIGVFHGPMGWVMWLLYLLGGIAFLAGLYALWQMIGSSEPLAAIKWGVAALVLVQFTTVAKGFMGNHLEANRSLREIKRLELQVSLLRQALDRHVR